MFEAQRKNIHVPIYNEYWLCSLYIVQATIHQTQFQFLADYLFTLEIVINFNQSHILVGYLCASARAKHIVKAKAFVWLCKIEQLPLNHDVNNDDMMIFRARKHLAKVLCVCRICDHSKKKVIQKHARTESIERCR